MLIYSASHKAQNSVGHRGQLTPLTIEEEAGVLDAQSVGGHARVVAIVLLRDVGDHQHGGSAHDLDTDSLGIR